MKLYKHNGREVGSKIYSLIDTIIETSYTVVHNMTHELKILYLLNNCEENLKIDLHNETHDMINELVVYHISINTWEIGWYSDLDVTSYSLENYIINWGCE